MKHLIFITSAFFLIFSIGTCFAQDKSTSNSANNTILAFMKDIYFSNKPTNDIAKNYIKLSNSYNSLSNEKRYDIVSSHIQMLRDGKSLGISTIDVPILENVSIIPYNDLDKSQAIIFEGNTDQLIHIYASLEKNKITHYFFYKDGKILSFDYIKKGINGPNYFIEY